MPASAHWLKLESFAYQTTKPTQALGPQIQLELMTLAAEQCHGAQSDAFPGHFHAAGYVQRHMRIA